jgi:hypothetical protein
MRTPSLLSFSAVCAIKLFLKRLHYNISKTYLSSISNINHGEKINKKKQGDGHNAKKRDAQSNPPKFFRFRRLVLFVFFLGNYFFPVVVAAAFAHSVRLGQFVAMRAFHQRGRSGFIICESLVCSALGLFTLGYCHIYTSCLISLIFQYRMP